MLNIETFPVSMPQPSPSENTFHAALRPLEAAASLTRRGMTCVPNPLSTEGGLGWAEGARLAAVRHKILLLRRHFALARTCRRLGERPILVREFSTIPLLLAAPLFLPLRPRVRFLVNHNLQWAVRGGAERGAWRALQRLGFRMLFFETTGLGLPRGYGLDRPGHGVIPFPVPARPSGIRATCAPGTLPRIGIAGHRRPEKDMAALMARLAAAGRGRWRVVVGSPDPEPTGEAGMEWIDTSSPEAYRTFLRGCDVIVLAPRADAYQYRPSGVLADAVSEGTPVVAPDFPLFRRQLTWPCAVGEVVGRPEDLPASIECALARSAADEYDFAAYRDARGPEALARTLDELESGE
jgi:hypothetical protein